MKHQTLLAGLALVALSTGAAMANPVIYSQASLDSGDFYSSQNDNVGGQGDFAKVYDNFTLSQTKSVTDVHWTGGFFNGTAAPISSFLIEIWGDNAGVPAAAPLLSTTVTGTANQTAVGSFGGLDYFSYDADLTTALTATAGTTYWLSIQATVGFPPQWGWATGSGGDDQSHQVFFGSPGAVPSDMAFSLTGTDVTSVPEPGGLALVALGLAGLAATRRRRTA